MIDPPNTTTTTRTKLMFLFQLVVRTITSITLAGALSGAGFGVLYLVIVSDPLAANSANLLRTLGFNLVFGGIFGALFGGVVGLLAGITSAIVTSLLTFLIFYPPTNERLYTILIRTLTALTASITVYWIEIGGPFRSTDSYTSQWDANPITSPTLLIIPAIAAITSFWVSGRITRWYLRQFQPQPTQSLTGNPTS